ncbi:hypothetical protein EG329_002261 [Mollisiaceae sp. DMI_Dod_QoI]|nr:hypothetical protein EG329_002261 [Helotiales sp. DMI_Dod_QoI]
MASNTIPVLIIGAGLAGLSLAKVLRRHGIPAVVFESSSSDRTQGYGITIRQFAYDPLLKELGRSPEELKRASATDKEAGGTGMIDSSLRDVYTGKILVKAPPARKGAEEQEFYRANRNALRSWLGEGCDIHFNHKLVSFKMDKEAGTVTAEFQNGKSAAGCLLVAADGIHSTVRKQLLPNIQPRILPAIVYNGERQMTRSTFESVLGPFMENTNVIIGAGDNSNFAITLTNLTPTVVDLNWSFTRPVKDDNDPLYDSVGGSGDERKVPPELLDELDNSSISEPYSTIISSESIKAHGLFHWIMRSLRVPRKDLDQLAEEHVVFVGDAVHGMPIFAREGGNHALVDAVELGQSLSTVLPGSGEDDIAACLRSFYDRAFPRWQKGIEDSEQRLHSLHRPIKFWRDVAANKPSTS